MLKRLILTILLTLLPTLALADGVSFSGVGINDQELNTITFSTTGSTIDCDITVTGSPMIRWIINGVWYTVADPGLVNFGSSATRQHSLYVSDWSKVTSFDSHDVATFVIDIDQFATKARAWAQGSFDIGNASGSVGSVSNFPAFTGSLICSYCSLLTGSPEDFPSGLLTNLNCSTCSGITGDIANFPSSITGNLICSSSGVTSYTSPGSWPFNTGNTKTIHFGGLSLSQAEVDDVLIDLAAESSTGGTVILTGNAVPSAAGLAAKTTLEGRGWTVTIAS